MAEDKEQMLAWLRSCLTNPEYRTKVEIGKRRIYCLENDIVYQNPFVDPTEEMLFNVWRGSLPVSPVVDISRYEQILPDYGDDHLYDL
jgi:hypothetical protein